MTPFANRIVFLGCSLLAACVAVNALVLQSRAPDLGSETVTGQTLLAEDRAIPAGAAAHSPTAASLPTGPDSVSTGELTDDPGATAFGSDKENARLVRAIQRELTAKGYAPGPVDGTTTLITRAAIMAYETDTRRPLTASPSEALLQSLLLGTPPTLIEETAAPGTGRQAARVIAQVQRLLTQRGYNPDPPGGRLGTRTAAAIRAFEEKAGLPVSGRISGPLMVLLLEHPEGARDLAAAQ